MNKISLSFYSALVNFLPLQEKDLWMWKLHLNNVSSWWLDYVQGEMAGFSLLQEE